MINGKILDIKVKNFRLFKDMDFDFTEKVGKAKSVIIIYGENGAGKSSITDLFSFLHDSIDTISNGNLFSSLFSEFGKEVPPQALIDSFIGDASRGSKDLIDKNKRIGSDNELMELSFTFFINGKLGKYSLSYNNQKLLSESLDYQASERMINIFSISDKSKGESCLNKTIFKDGDAKEKLLNSINQKFGLHSFLAILNQFIKDSNVGYIKDNISQSVLDVLRFFSSIVIYGNRFSIKPNFSSEKSLHLLSNPMGHHFSKSNAKYIERTTEALSLYLKSLYSRILRVEIVQDNNTVNGSSYSFYFIEKGADGKTIRVPFNKESTGTKNVVNLFASLFAASSGYMVVIDEIDEGIHDVLMKDIMESIIGDIEGQLIITTHNTLLMKTVSPKSIYLLNFEDGGERFYSLDEVNGRVPKDADVIGRYLKGLYGGVPYSSSLSMGAIKLALEERGDDVKKN
jgi:AAA15 family ATPase/GTPase